MWTRVAALSLTAHRAHGCLVGRRSFTTSLQKRALKALGNTKQQTSGTHENDEINKETSSSIINGDILKESSNIQQIQTQENEIVKEDVLTKEVEQEVVVLNAQSENKPSATVVAPPGQLHEFAPRIVVAGVGGGGGNAINNMISKGLQGTIDECCVNSSISLSTNICDCHARMPTLTPSRWIRLL